MREFWCANCGGSRWDHISCDGMLLCPQEYDPEPPTCWYCDDGWPREGRDRRKNADNNYVCAIDHDLTHRTPPDSEEDD